MTQGGGDLSQYNSKEREEKNMTYFAKMNKHEQKILVIWLDYTMAIMDGMFDYMDEEPTFEEYLKEESEWYSEECGEKAAEPYRQALAEWQA